MELTITTKDLQALIDTEIVTLKGISGAPLNGPDAATKAQGACGIIQMYAMSGLTFEVTRYDGHTDTFTMEPQ